MSLYQSVGILASLVHAVDIVGAESQIPADVGLLDMVGFLQLGVTFGYPLVGVLQFSVAFLKFGVYLGKLVIAKTELVTCRGKPVALLRSIVEHEAKNYCQYCYECRYDHQPVPCLVELSLVFSFND